MKNLIIIFILFIESVIIYGDLIVNNNVYLDCGCYVENLNQIPTSIYLLSSEIKNSNNKIISRIDIKENSNVDTIFSFVDKSDTLKLLNLINNQTIIMNDKEEYLAISKNNIITKDLNDTFKIGMNADCVNKSYVEERMDQFNDFENDNGQQIFYDRLSMDYYILKINSSVLGVTHSSILNNNTENYSFNQFSEYFKNSNGSINFLAAVKKVVFFGYQETETKYSIYQCIENKGILPFITINYTISNVIQSENINYILLYSSNSQKLFILNVQNNTIENEISEFNLHNKEYKIDSLISKGGITQIDKSIYSTSKPTFKEEEKKVFPIALPIAGVVLILVFAIVIKVVLKKRREKIGFIDLKEEKTSLQDINYYGDNELNPI